MESSAVYSHSAARDLLCLYSKNPHVTAKAKELFKRIRIKLAVLESVPGIGYLFKTHDFVGMSSDSLKYDFMVKSRAIRDYLAETAKELAKVCVDPAQPHLEEFTLQYLQHKLIKMSRCPTIDAYLDEANGTPLAADFIGFLGKLSAGPLLSRQEKDTQKKDAQERTRQLHLQQVFRLCVAGISPFQATALAPYKKSLPVSIKPGHDSLELFDEFRFGKLRFALFTKPVECETLTLDLPHHIVMILAPIVSSTPCKIRAATTYIFDDIPERSYVEADGELALFKFKANAAKGYSVSGRPFRSVEGDHIPARANQIKSNLADAMAEFIAGPYQKPPSRFLQSLLEIAFDVMQTMPFEEARRRSNIPENILKEHFCQQDLRTETLHDFYQSAQKKQE